MPPSSERRTTAPTVADVVNALDGLCPFQHAAEWDNVGLLAGRPAARVRRVLLAIDLTNAVADDAIASRADAMVLYHPPIFKGVRSITPRADGPTTRLAELLGHGVALIALHTALDNAAGGTNDVLLDAFELSARRPLTPLITREWAYKLAVFVPAAGAADLRRALAAAGAGCIGDYDECSFESHGRGSFRGNERTNPTIGQRGRLEFVDEAKLEMIVPRERLDAVVRALHAAHSYEEPAFDLFPIAQVAGRGGVGAGRVGVLARPQRGDALVRRLAGRVQLDAAMVVGDRRRVFTSVTAAAGSFGVSAFRDPSSLVLTGELKHHDMLELLKRGVAAVLLGHDRSERPVLARVRSHLRASLPGAAADISRADRPAAMPMALARSRGRRT